MPVSQFITLVFIKSLYCIVNFECVAIYEFYSNCLWKMILSGNGQYF